MDEQAPKDNSSDTLNGRAVIVYPGTHVQDYGPQVRYPHYPQYGEERPREGTDLRNYLRIALKYKWLILGCLTTTLAAAMVITMLMTPVYRAIVTLQIDREAINVINLEGVQPEESSTGNEYFQTQYELLASRSLAERVVSTLGLDENRGFNRNDATLLGWLADLVGPDASEQTVASSEDEQTRRRRETVERLTASVSISPVRNSRIVRINFDHIDPVIARDVVNGYADVFIANNLDRRFEATSYARKFLEGRLSQLKLKLEESEKLLVRYAEEQGIINLQDNKNLSAADLEAINGKLVEARSERIKKELLFKQASEIDGLELKEILDSDSVKVNRKLRTELATEYQQKLVIFKPAFPDMVKLRNQIKELDRQLVTEVSAIKGAIKSEYLAAKQEEEELLAQLQSAKTDVVDQRNRSIQYNILQREVDTNRQLYDGLLQRYKEIGVAGGVGANNISVVDLANVPENPRSPSWPLNMTLALVLGLSLGGALALLLDYLDDSFRSPEDIERELGLPVIGVVPRPNDGNDIAEELADSRSAAAEAVRSLRTGLQFATSEGLPRTLLVTSSKPSEGKTTTTVALARALAQIGLKVLLVDGDLRNSSVHRKMAMSNELGLSNYLAGSKIPNEIVQASDLANLVVMTAGPLPPNPAELLTGPKFLNLLSLAVESFDMVLIDGPPIMGLADAPLLSTAANSTLILVAANETPRSTAKVALKRLRFAKANIVGAMLSKFDTRQAGDGYDYGYGDYDYHGYQNPAAAKLERR
jgi:succinoglycan biosynthesis transport protein ExoP